PRFSVGEVTAPARQLSQLVQRFGDLGVRRAVRRSQPIECLVQKTPGLVVKSAVGQRAGEVPADDCARWCPRAKAKVPPLVRSARDVLGSSQIAAFAMDAPKIGQRGDSVRVIRAL